MTGSLSIRPGHKSDLEPILALWGALMDEGQRADPRYRGAEDAVVTMRRHVAEDWFRPALPFPFVWVAEHDRTIKAFLTGKAVPPHPLLENAPTAQIETLYVHPERRRQGGGRALVLAFCEAADRAGFTRHSVYTLSRDERAMEFWRHMGFMDLLTELVREAPPSP